MKLFFASIGLWYLFGFAGFFFAGMDIDSAEELKSQTEGSTEGDYLLVASLGLIFFFYAAAGYFRHTFSEFTKNPKLYIKIRLKRALKMVSIKWIALWLMAMGYRFGRRDL